MVTRYLKHKLKEISSYYPIVFLIGPRQSGKTTLVKKVFSDLPYVLLEFPDVKQRAIDDPLQFLSNFPNGAIIDEAQNVPQLFSYLQGIVDQKPNIKFVLTGSQNFLLIENISQSLAGRVGILKLLPFALNELKNTQYGQKNVYEYIFKGMYPRVYDKNIPPRQYYSDYMQTYIERDVRSIKNIGDLNTFSKFVQLCAGRIGQLLNVDALATAASVSHNTAKSWLSVLEASYIVYTLKPYHKNFNKRLVKQPKLYFYDTGLASYLLNIKSAKEIYIHFLQGGLFENFIINQFLKQQYNKALQPQLYFWRDNHGRELDLVADWDTTLACEIKASQTYQSSHLKHLKYWQKLIESTNDQLFLINAGDTSSKLSIGNMVCWNDLDQIFEYE